MKPDLEGLAEAVLDAAPVDWEVVRSSADASDAALIAQLETLRTLRQVVVDARTAVASSPTAWGHLQVLERLGRGSFGEVFRAFDTRLDREVALKLLYPSAETAASGSSTIEEGRLLARVRHPNVVTIYGAERIDGRVGLWMEFIRGRTLEEALRAGATFSPAEAARIGTELCAAVEAVHAAGLLHRDIKAQNVMLSDEGRLVLMDFGAGTDVARVPDGGVAPGTPLYLAPELLNGGKATTGSDVYSLGVLLHRVLTGTYPVVGRDLADLRRAHRARSSVEVLPALPVTIPRPLRGVVARALDPGPGRRYRSAQSFGAALAAAGNGPARRRLAYARAAVVGLVGLGLWTGMGLFRPDSASQTGQTPGTAVPTIAIMPFTNLASEPGSGDFVDGLTSEVIRNLAQIDGLRVRSRTSSFYFKDRPRDLATIADQLNVGLIVEATVHRSGDRLRVTAQLVQVPEDVLLWSERFDRNANDVFAIQEEISRAIVDKLRLTLGQGQRRYETNLAAYEVYLRARVLVGRGGTEYARQAIRLFEQVIRMDPAFAPAHAGLALAYAEISWQLSEGSLPAQAGLEGMRPAAERALALDPLLAEAHAAMGVTYARERAWAQAEEAFQRAIALNPGLTLVHTNFALTVLIPLDRFADARRLLTGALESDPLSATVQRELGWALYYDGRFDEAIEHFRSAIAIDPAVPFTAQGIARALTFGGRPDEAIAVWEERPVTDGAWERWLSHAYAKAGRTADLQRLIEANANEHPVRQAIVYSAAGDLDRTFAALDRAVDLSPPRVAQLLPAPEMSLLRGDARLAALRRRLNLP